MSVRGRPVLGTSGQPTTGRRWLRELTGPDLPRGAACKGRAPLFDLDALLGETATERDARHDAAKLLCSECPVRQECREAAHREWNASGIWAGKLYARQDNRHRGAA